MGVLIKPGKEEFALHMAQMLNDAASRVGVLIKPLRMVYVSHMVNDVTSKEDVLIKPLREEFAKRMAPRRHVNDAISKEDVTNMR